MLGPLWANDESKRVMHESWWLYKRPYKGRTWPRIKKRWQRKKSTRRVGRHQLLLLPTHRHAIKLMGNVTRVAGYFVSFINLQWRSSSSHPDEHIRLGNNYNWRMNSPKDFDFKLKNSCPFTVYIHGKFFFFFFAHFCLYDTAIRICTSHRAT